MARGKSISRHCTHCERVTKMQMIGAVENDPDRVWYRCMRCRHASLIDMSDVRKAEDEARKKLDPSECFEYSPAQTYSIGQAIIHSEWGVGKIVSKERTSGGQRAIVVSFEKLGERRLLESVAGNHEID